MSSNMPFCDGTAMMYYNNAGCSTANQGQALSYNTSASLSMTLLDQLPLFVYATPDQCLLRDDVLRKPPYVVSEDSVRYQKIQCRGPLSRLLLH